MQVDYKKLWIMLIEKRMTKADLRRAADLSPATLTKLNQNKFISMEILVRLCGVLDCDIGDLVSAVKNDNDGE